jgi:AAA domain
MPQYKTMAFDSAGDLARLYFSNDLKKHSKDTESIRQMNNYPGVTERLNMLVRRLKNARDAGIEVVFTAHEDIEKVYAKGSGMAGRGQPAPDPIAVKGWPDLPGKRAPEEFGRAADNILRVRRINQDWRWIAVPENIGPGAGNWEVKDRFNAPAIQNGYLPNSYAAIAELASKNPKCNWDPPYIWLIYGPFGSHKTRSLLTFPRPMVIFDTDRGTKSLAKSELTDITIKTYDPEECDDYTKFVGDMEACMP